MRLQRYLNEDNNELEQMFSDMIELHIEDGNMDKAKDLMKKFKEKLGYEYTPHKEFIPKPSLDKIYSKDDFKRYNDYIKYSENLFTLKFNTYSNKATNPSKPYTTNQQVEQLLNQLNIKALYGRPKGTEEAYVGMGTDKIMFDQKYLKTKIPKEMIIHELGHIFDNMKKQISSKTDISLHHMKSSNYDMNPSEIFAEHFLNYFVRPNYLKAGWKEVYIWMDNKIPSNMKKAIKTFLKA